MGKSMNIAIDKMITQLINMVLSSDKFSWKKLWINMANGNSPYNPITKNVYKGINRFVLMFYSSLNGSNQYITFKQMKSKGGYLNKGAKGIPLVFFKYMYKDPQTGKWYSEKDIDKLSTTIVERLIKRVFINGFYVYSVTDTDLTFKQPKPTKVNTPIETAQKVIDEYGNVCRIVQGVDNSQAFYSPGQDYINLPDRNAFDDSESFYHVAFHEISHSTGHKDRLNRDFDKGGFFGDDKYSKEELVAELAANIMSAKMNLLNDKLLKNSAAYLQGWSKKMTDKKTELYEALFKASKAVDFVFNKVEIES